MKFSTFHLFHRFEGQTAREVYDYQLEIAELCEELGFDGLWVPSTTSATTASRRAAPLRTPSGPSAVMRSSAAR